MPAGQRRSNRLGPAQRLLVIAHGTASAAGRATLEELVAAVASVRPRVAVDLCYLDVLDPRLPAVLDDRPTVAVPLLLSTGYHVQTDIPAAVAAHPRTIVARHLGPDDRLTDVLVDRLGDLPATTSIALVATGSSRPDAAVELDDAAARLADRLARDVQVLTIDQVVRGALADLPGPIRVATYVLADGRFLTALRDAAAGLADVAPPLGVHPALIKLVWARYDEAPRAGD